jgi:hypothetical protein
MNFEENFARRHPNGVEKRGGLIFIAVEIAREFIGVRGASRHRHLRNGWFSSPPLGFVKLRRIAFPMQDN